ncbi:MAG: hypothetical protein ACR2PF_11090 [Rhizobiaceae bacterium]
MPIEISGAEKHPHAARRLEEALGAETRPGADPVNIVLTEESSLTEGGFSISASASERKIAIRGGPFSGVIYGAEELIRRSPDGIDVAALENNPVEDSPALPFRTVWTWDHSTNWELTQVGQQEIGVFNPYQKPPGGFLLDYQRLVDHCSKHRIAGVVIYGFLRDNHGGTVAAQELCRYANERGVRIIPGIAIGAYGGVYWEGNHKYNLSTWLKSNPQFAAQMEKDIGFQIADLAFPLNFPHSDYTMTACPSAPATIEWMEEAVAWLAETFDIGGINIESGDYGVCGCPRCVERRANPDEAARRVDDHGDSWSHTDMAQNFPRLYAAAKAKKPDLWIYCEMQWDNLLDPVADDAQKALPEGGIYQYTSNRTFWGRLQKELTHDYVASLPTRPNVLRCQFACQWNGDERSERYAFNARTFADMSKTVQQTGMQGLTIWSEPSPFHATVELSYLAFARFGWQPDLSWENFLAEDVAPLLGGPDAANSFIEIAEEVDENQELPLERLQTLQKSAMQQFADTSGDVARRWLTLGEQIARRIYMGR